MYSCQNATLLEITCHGSYDFVLQEIDLFVSSLNQLKLAQTKFVESQESLIKVSPDSKDKDILVPLTSSVSFIFSLSQASYVSGTIQDCAF